MRELTSAEERVASCAVRGKTSREIGRELGLSARTVEAHLLRIYRKLGLRSRAELAFYLGRGDPANEPNGTLKKAPQSGTTMGRK